VVVMDGEIWMEILCWCSNFSLADWELGSNVYTSLAGHMDWLLIYMYINKLFIIVHPHNNCNYFFSVTIYIIYT
jgi:hypothetical protein